MVRVIAAAPGSSPRPGAIDPSTLHPIDFGVELKLELECKAGATPPTGAVVAAGLFPIPGVVAIAAPTGCAGTAHPALLTDSEGLKAVASCNGTNNYRVVKPFA